VLALVVWWRYRSRPKSPIHTSAPVRTTRVESRGGPD
jgi:hypothetical protein